MVKPQALPYFNIINNNNGKRCQETAWLDKLYESTGNLGLVCCRCGISRPTLRKWVQRYKELGMGLSEHSRRPLRIKTKITPEDVSNILVLRKNRKLGHRSIVSEMKRLHGRSFSTATIQKILEQHNCKYLKLKRGYRKRTNRYSRPIPGDRVQMDVCKIGPGLYQYTAIDDCSRFKVLALYPRWTAANTLRFLELVLEQMPFPIQRIQTDRGNESFAENFQKNVDGVWH